MLTSITSPPLALASERGEIHKRGEIEKNLFFP
jgi:hypothetical protein